MFSLWCPEGFGHSEYMLAYLALHICDGEPTLVTHI